MLNLTKQRLSEVLSLNSNSVFADNSIMSYPTCSGISCSADCADRDPRLRKDDVKSKSKDDSTKAQSGRSMIEMLGVLAIIGVLSVGGIAGYSKAMMQYKINKTADQITQIVGNVRTLYAGQKSYNGFGYSCGSDYISVIKKAHLAPEEMWTSNTGAEAHNFLENPFGGGVTLNCANKKSSGDHKAFGVDLYNLPEEACMALATYDWGSGSSSGLISVSVNSSSVVADNYSVGCAGSSADGKAVACPNGSTVSVPMPVNIAATACQEGESNQISLKFY